jgi:2-octaprenyl-6-methoxyphenol hydroxylase
VITSGKPRHDVVLVGAGPVGATFALALRDADLDVVALDARPAGSIARGDRSLALSHGSRLILERVGAWPRLASSAAAVTPITAIDVSQAGGLGAMRLDASEHDLPALGYVVSYRALQAALDEALAATGIRIAHDTRVVAVNSGSEHAEIVAEHGEARLARLAVAADGAGASVPAIERRRRDYRQVAVVAKVWLDRPHRGVAIERFTPTGPVALLPEGDHCGLVWTQAPDEAARSLDLPDAAFIAALERHAGAVVRGITRVAERRTFPLVLEYAQDVVAPHVAVIGNAAQALHPIAGQGFNLGLRDAFELAQQVIEQRSEIGERGMLARYAARRARDRRLAIAFTDGLVHLFGGTMLRGPRGLGLALLDALPPVRRAFARAMMLGWR